MEGSIQISEQRLLQISVDLLDRMAEVQKLRESVQAVEAAKALPRPSGVTPDQSKRHRAIARLISAGPLWGREAQYRWTN